MYSDVIGNQIFGIQMFTVCKITEMVRCRKLYCFKIRMTSLRLDVHTFWLTCV
jgi:hypothetical protein